MTKPLLGGSAIAIVLLSASLTFTAQTSVAEPLAFNPQNQHAQQKNDFVAEVVSSESAAPANSTTIAKANGLSVEARESGPTQSFVATAYCLRGRMANGSNVAKGFIAADRHVLPIGTRVRLEAGNYSGEYVVADTGGAVRGRKIDIWVPSTGEAMRFGRRAIKLTVLTRVRPAKATRAR
ncbi:MAG: 3D domain-containing protein [Pyrinomonadaceae bacterium]